MEHVCQQCGCCCRHFIVEAGILDVLREPRLLQTNQCGEHGPPTIEELERGEKVVIVAMGQRWPCKFLGPDNQCTIYPTRPNECVAFVAGSAKCLEARDHVD